MFPTSDIFMTVNKKAVTLVFNVVIYFGFFLSKGEGWWPTTDGSGRFLFHNWMKIFYKRLRGCLYPCFISETVQFDKWRRISQEMEIKVVSLRSLPLWGWNLGRDSTWKPALVCLSNNSRVLQIDVTNDMFSFYL